MFVHGLSQSSSKSIKFASKNDLKFGAFWVPEGVKITIFRGPHLRLSFKGDSTACPLPNGPQNEPQNYRIWVSIFITFFATHLDPYFNDCVSQRVPKMVPKTDLFSDLRPC